MRGPRASAPPKAARAAASVAAAAAAPLSGIATAPSGINMSGINMQSLSDSEDSEAGASEAGGSEAGGPAAASPGSSRSASPCVSRLPSTGADAAEGAAAAEGFDEDAPPSERLAALLRMLPGGDALPGAGAPPRSLFSAPEDGRGAGVGPAPGFSALTPRSLSLPTGALGGLARTLSRVHRRGDSFSSMRHLEGQAAAAAAAPGRAAAAAAAAVAAERPLVFIHGVGLGLVRGRCAALPLTLCQLWTCEPAHSCFCQGML